MFGSKKDDKSAGPKRRFWPFGRKEEQSPKEEAVSVSGEAAPETVAEPVTPSPEPQIQEPHTQEPLQSEPVVEPAPVEVAPEPAPVVELPSRNLLSLRWLQHLLLCKSRYRKTNRMVSSPE